jgi:hypothetical protein
MLEGSYGNSWGSRGGSYHICKTDGVMSRKLDCFCVKGTPQYSSWDCPELRQYVDLHENRLATVSWGRGEDKE